MSLVKKFWGKWISIARPIGNFQVQVLFCVFYLVVLSVVGIGLKMFSDPLRIKNKKKTNFQPWEHPQEELEQARRAY